MPEVRLEREGVAFTCSVPATWRMSHALNMCHTGKCDSAALSIVCCHGRMAPHSMAAGKQQKLVVRRPKTHFQQPNFASTRQNWNWRQILFKCTSEMNGMGWDNGITQLQIMSCRFSYSKLKETWCPFCDQTFEPSSPCSQLVNAGVNFQQATS